MHQPQEVSIISSICQWAPGNKSIFTFFFYHFSPFILLMAYFFSQIKCLVEATAPYSKTNSRRNSTHSRLTGAAFWRPTSSGGRRRWCWSTRANSLQWLCKNGRICPPCLPCECSWWWNKPTYILLKNKLNAKNMCLAIYTEHGNLAIYAERINGHILT